MSAKIKFRIQLVSDTLSDLGMSIRNALKLRSVSSEALFINDTSHQPSVGRGFFSFVREVLYLISVNSEKDIFVDYRHTVYNDSPQENMWQYCFEPVVNDPKAKKIYRYFFLTRSHRNPYSDLNRRHRMLFHRIFNDRIRIKKDILDKVEQFYTTRLKGKKCLGVQYRGAVDAFRMAHGATGKPDPYFIKYPLQGYFEKIDNLLISGSFSKIFLATDDPAALKAFERRYGDKVAAYSTQQDVTVAGIRFMRTSNRRILAEEVLIDCLLLSTCAYLLHGASNIPTVARYLNPDMPAENVDLKKHSLARTIAFKTLYF